ncbi:hypothetical protein ACIP1G_31420, partial [Pseudomonas sp. NPDC089392]|uniref:hypothetical protein n=1 Tax=Pseudomonas sp. NPDC089392 TaxID=3364459 RepID=UPI00380B1640
PHRRDWPETDVGAALCCEAPRGRRSISQAIKILCQAPGSQNALSKQAKKRPGKIAGSITVISLMRR